VSVIAPEGYLSDSLSTAVFILGADKGLALLKSKGYDGVLVTKDREVIVTDNMKDKIEILNNSYKLQITNYE
jgi:thiamine biosynthesis lipoprotein